MTCLSLYCRIFRYDWKKVSQFQDLQEQVNHLQDDLLNSFFAGASECMNKIKFFIC